MPHRPTAKQDLFLLHDDVREALYGGAAGGGKTDALLMAALQYVDTPGYAALVLMRSYADLSLPSAGMDRLRRWLAGTEARPADGGRAWRFPSGASVTFGYLQNAGDEQRYRTAEFQFIGLDELTRFDEPQYRFLFSRLRRLAGSDVPLRVRAATNLGGRGHEWVKRRFIPDSYHAARGEARFGRPWWKEGRLFVPARRGDNEHLDQAAYAESLSQMVALERARLDEGDWQAHEGGHFKAHWFGRYSTVAGGDWLLRPRMAPAYRRAAQVAVAVDPAGGTSESADPTAMVVGARLPAGEKLVLDVVRERFPVEEVVPQLARLCRKWGPDFVVMEEEFLQSAYVREARRTPGVPTVRGVRTGGKGKLDRATPAILEAEQGRVYLPDAAEAWVEPFLAELCAFTGDERLDGADDQVDAFAWLVWALDRFRSGQADVPFSVGGRGR